MMQPEFLTAPKLLAPHGFFTRRGGVSTGPYASLNCSLSGADARDTVLENRARAARAIGGAPDRLVGLSQVHGIDVVTVTEPWAPGEGPRADGMVTRTPGICLGIVTADCVPVLFAAADGQVVGAVHAGWRGAVAGALEATLAAMEPLGAAPAAIVAAIGPCIRQRSYEVGADLRDAVLAHNPDNAHLFKAGHRPEHWQFDLVGYCTVRLLKAGVSRVAIIPGDTASDVERFFSHRRRTLAGGGPIGHQISIIRPA